MHRKDGGGLSPNCGVLVQIVSRAPAASHQPFCPTSASCRVLQLVGRAVTSDATEQGAKTLVHRGFARDALDSAVPCASISASMNVSLSCTAAACRVRRAKTSSTRSSARSGRLCGRWLKYNNADQRRRSGRAGPDAAGRPTSRRVRKSASRRERFRYRRVSSVPAPPQGGQACQRLRSNPFLLHSTAGRRP